MTHSHGCPACGLDIIEEWDCARGGDHDQQLGDCRACDDERTAWELSLGAGEYDALMKRAMDYLPPIRHGR